MHAELGNEDQAVADLTRAVNLGSQSGDVYAVRGAQMVLIGSPRQGLADLNVGMTQGLSRVSEYYLYSSRAIAFYDLGRFEESAYSAKKALSSPGAERRKHNAYMDWIAFNANERCGKYDAAYASLLAAIEKNPEQAKEIECGFVQVINKTKTAVRFCPDYWIDYDGNKVDINNYRFFNGLQAFWTLQPGDSVVINYDGKPFRASTISAWLEDTESSKHGGTWTWTSSGGSLHTTIELLDKMLP